MHSLGERGPVSGSPATKDEAAASFGETAGRWPRSHGWSPRTMRSPVTPKAAGTFRPAADRLADLRREFAKAGVAETKSPGYMALVRDYGRARGEPRLCGPVVAGIDLDRVYLRLSEHPLTVRRRIDLSRLQARGYLRWPARPLEA